MTSGADTATGGAGAETIYGEGGNDSITMNGGADSVAAGSGADTVYGGSGDDSLAGDSGDDSIYGGMGADILSGSAGADRIEGGSGGDVLLGGSGNDTLLGNSGPDTIYGGTGDDSINGGSGDDSLSGGSGNDTIYGYSGNDTLTGDNGLQPILWIGRRRISTTAETAPVVITEGTWGANRPLKVSPQHRLLFAGWQAEVLFGEPEVLIPAKHLVDGRSIRRKSDGDVVYFHVCLERHEILCADGVAAESFLPGDIGTAALPEDQLQRLYAALPALRADVNALTPARPLLKGYEAQALHDLIANARTRPVADA
jgi:Ca2+-binding RTX toxin-like protein